MGKRYRVEVKKARLSCAGHIIKGTEKLGKVVEDWLTREWKRKQERPPTKSFTSS